MSSKRSKRKPTKNFNKGLEEVEMKSAQQIETQQDVYKADFIVKMKTVKGKSQYLVKWEGYSKCTWEPAENILDPRLLEEFKDLNQKKAQQKKMVENAVNESMNTKRKKSANIKDVDVERVNEKRKRGRPTRNTRKADDKDVDVEKVKEKRKRGRPTRNTINANAKDFRGRAQQFKRTEVEQSCISSDNKSAKLKKVALGMKNKPTSKVEEKHTSKGDAKGVREKKTKRPTKLPLLKNAVKIDEKNGNLDKMGDKIKKMTMGRARNEKRAERILMVQESIKPKTKTKKLGSSQIPDSPKLPVDVNSTALRKKIETPENEYTIDLVSLDNTNEMDGSDSREAFEANIPELAPYFSSPVPAAPSPVPAASSSVPVLISQHPLTPSLPAAGSAITSHHRPLINRPMLNVAPRPKPFLHATPTVGLAARLSPAVGYGPRGSPTGGYGPRGSSAGGYAPRVSPAGGYSVTVSPTGGLAASVSPYAGYAPRFYQSPSSMAISSMGGNARARQAPALVLNPRARAPLNPALVLNPKVHAPPNPAIVLNPRARAPQAPSLLMGHSIPATQAPFLLMGHSIPAPHNSPSHIMGPRAPYQMEIPIRGFDIPYGRYSTPYDDAPSSGSLLIEDTFDNT